MEKLLIASKSITINAPVSKVWNIITTAETVKNFMQEMKPETDWKEGSSMNWVGRHEGEEHNAAKGKILVLQPNKKLQYSFFYGGYGHADIPENYQTVTLELEEVNKNKTNFSATQGDYSVFTDGETYLKHAEAFWEKAVDVIKKLSESN